MAKSTGVLKHLEVNQSGKICSLTMLGPWKIVVESEKSRDSETGRVKARGGPTAGRGPLAH